MKLFSRLYLTGFATSLFSSALFSQTYILNGNATQNTCNCYTLTQPLNFQGGSVWNANKINLNTAFDFAFNVNLGCIDVNGADGIVFILQPISTSLGTSGGGMGYEGVNPSIGVSLDTWQNTINNDPDFDHISIQANGFITHGSDLAGPVQASATNPNIEDCQWHVLRISWDPATLWIRTWFDSILRLETQKDIIGTIFNNQPLVYWGFSAATGGSVNLQQFCTALNPKFITNFSSNSTCIGTPVIFQDQSESFGPIQSYYWDLGDGTSTTVPNPPAHLYASPGIYQVKHVITALDGCVSDTIPKTISIGSIPVADFDVYDTCYQIPPLIIDRSGAAVGVVSQWSWMLDGSAISVAQQPQLDNILPGTHQLQLIVTTNIGCVSAPISKSFILKNIPIIDVLVEDGCVNEPVTFNAIQLDNLTSITQWNWRFDDGSIVSQQNTTHQFSTQGNHPVSFWAETANGCSSDIINKTVSINKAIAFAGNDTIVIKDIPFQMHASGGIMYQWSPSMGLNDASIADPTASLQDDITYTLTVTTAEGCKDIDEVHITVFKGSAIYIPNAFTPNHDGLNDRLKPYYVGIKKLDFFTIYNRWGELVFTTNDLAAGWDGRQKETDVGTGSFVWILQAVDYVGKVYQLKGTVILIR